MIKPVLVNLNGVIPENTKVLNFTNNVLPTGKEFIDLSTTKDNKIVAWLEDDGYTLNISTQNNTGVGIENNEVFKGLSNIEEIYSNGYVGTDKCKDMSNMFSDCVKLDSLDLTGWNFTNVSNVEDMFANTKISWLHVPVNHKLNEDCIGLYPDGDINGVWIKDSNNSEYKVGELPLYDSIYVTENGFAVLGPLKGKVPSGSKFIIFKTLTEPFKPNPNYEYIDVSKNQDGSVLGYYGAAGYYSDNAFYIFATKPNTKIRVIQKEGDIGVFQYTPMSYIVYNNNVDFTRTTCTSYMFANCSNLVNGGDNTINKVDYGWSIISSNLTFRANIEKADHMYANCTSLHRGYVNFYSENLKDISYMFSGCTNLQQPLEGSSFISASQYVENMEGYMYNCSSAINGAAVTPVNVKNMSYFYYGCKSMQSGIDNLSTSNARYNNLEDISYMYAYSCPQAPINFQTKIDFSTIKNYTGIFQGATITVITLPAGHPFNDKSSGLVPNGQANGYWYVAKSSTSYKAYSLPTSTAGSYRSEANSRV